MKTQHEKLTRINPDGVTYRVPLDMAGEFRVIADSYNTCIMGDIINRLGEYEKLGSLEEIARKIKNT